jgi:hypothetical protein
VAPPGTGTVDVKATGPGGSSVDTSLDQYTYASGPVVNGVSPSNGTPGTSVTISGTGFTGATGVTFGSNAATFTASGDNTITAVAPTTSGGVDVRVTTPAGTSSAVPSDRFLYTGAAVTGLRPASAPKDGCTVVQINGSGFTGATAVSFGGVAALSYAVASDGSISAYVPAGMGTVDAQVTTPSGTSAISAADHLTYTTGPSVYVIGPNAGSTAGGTTVLLSGSGFTGATSVIFGATSASSFRVTSDSTILAVSPPGSGSQGVTVVTPSGTSAKNQANTFTYYPQPVVTGLSVSSGPSSGGTTVTIFGNLDGVTAATAVHFGKAAATFITSVGPTMLVATSPPGTGTVDVTVTGPAGTSAKTGADLFTYTAMSTSPNTVYERALRSI